MKQTLPYEMFDGAKAVNFYRYKSTVTDRIYSISTWREEEQQKYKKELQFLTAVKDELLQLNPNVRWDNKVVIEFVAADGQHFYLGCFDEVWSIGPKFNSEWMDEPIKLQ